MRLGGLVSIVAVSIPLVGCGLIGEQPPDENDVAFAFTQAVASGDVGAAGRLTDDPEAAGASISQLRSALAPTSIGTRLDGTDRVGDTVTASYTTTWYLDGDREWTFQGEFALAQTGDDRGWSVRWTPSVLHPQLASGQRIELREDPVDNAPVLDRSGGPLLTSQEVVAVSVNREGVEDLPATASALAGPLSEIDPAITADTIVAGANTSPLGTPYVAAVLRYDDYLTVRDRIYDLRGVTFPTQVRLLGPDADFASLVMPGIRTLAEGLVAGTEGWRIVTVTPMGAEVAVLAEQAPTPAPAITSTLDLAIQAAAEDALEPVSTPAMLVAIQPSTGEVLAVAQNAAADAGGHSALTGRYPPGSTFKIVTAAAALDDGAVGLDTPVQCPGTTVVQTRLVPNLDRFDLGTVPLRTAFARSCNTTFAQLAGGFGATEMTDAANRLGLGQDYEIPEITTVTGSVPPSDDVVQRAENGFGQGQVLASPFGMALVTATVASGGTVHTPSLVRGTETSVLTEPAAPFDPEVIDAVRTMMREVITQGSGEGLGQVAGLHGKTGTAEYDDPASRTGSHGWFAGFLGGPGDDLAFATLVVDAGASAPAVEASGRFLAAVDR